eukprot:gene5081-3319_t
MYVHIRNEGTARRKGNGASRALFVLFVFLFVSVAFVVTPAAVVGGGERLLLSRLCL